MNRLKTFFRQYYLMSRKIHKVHIPLTNNNIDTTGAVSRDTISVQLKNFENFVFQKNHDHATHFKPSFLVKKTVIWFTRLKAKTKPWKKHVRKNAKMRPQLNHTETEIKKEDFKEESTTPTTIPSCKARSKNWYMAHSLF